MLYEERGLTVVQAKTERPDELDFWIDLSYATLSILQWVHQASKSWRRKKEQRRRSLQKSMTRCQTDRMHNVLSAACANQPGEEAVAAGWLTKHWGFLNFCFKWPLRPSRLGRGFHVASAMLAKTAKSMGTLPCSQVRFQARALNDTSQARRNRVLSATSNALFSHKVDRCNIASMANRAAVSVSTSLCARSRLPFCFKSAHSRTWSPTRGAAHFTVSKNGKLGLYTSFLRPFNIS